MSKKIYTPSISRRTARPRSPRLQTSGGGHTVVKQTDGHTTIDTEMSDTSDNAVANRIIKAYADLSPKYKVVGEVTDPEIPEDNNPEGSSGGAIISATPRMKLRHIAGRLYVHSNSDLVEATIQLGRLGRSYSGKKDLPFGKRSKIKKNGWRIYNHETKKDENNRSDTRLIGMRLIHSPRLDYPGEYRYVIEFVTDNFETMDAAYALASSFGSISTGVWHMSTSHGTKIIGDDSSASQTFAVVINGTYLPFRLFMLAISDSDYSLGLTPI